MRNSHYLSPKRNNELILIESNERKRYNTESADKKRNVRTIPISILKKTNVALSTATKSNQSFSKKSKSPLKNLPDIPNPIIKKSTKRFNPLNAYAVSTHHGLYHLINEDKISIHLSRFLIFSIFDGYSGSFASEFLKQNMLIDIMHNIQKDNMEKLLLETFERVDKRLLEQQRKKLDKSGSSALVCLIHKKTLYIANCGTSSCFGRTTKKQLIKLNNLHKCQNPNQYARIGALGGVFYKTRISIQHAVNKFAQGPLRIHPYGLNITRCMGNIQAKSKYFHANTSLIISKPEIKYIKTEQLEWICLCSEGLHQFIDQNQMNNCIQQLGQTSFQNEHDYAQKCVQQIMRTALGRGCNQNASIILLIFKQMQVKKQVQIKKISKDISLKYIGGRPNVIHQK